jgi:hypothetical protein
VQEALTAMWTATGSLAKHITRVGAGPEGMTVKAAEGAVIDAWLAAK